MKKLVLFLLLIALSLVYFSPAPTSATSPPPSNKDTWLQGAAGYERGLQLQKELNVPLVVYFWAGWCPYCQALDSKYLPTKPVQEYMREVVKVRIYPEQGAAERALAKQYNVRGYPSFFIIRDSSARPVKVHPFRGSRNLTPEEFAEACQKAGPISTKTVAARNSQSTSRIIERRPDTATPAVSSKRNTSGGMQIVTVVPAPKY